MMQVAGQPSSRDHKGRVTLVLMDLDPEEIAHGLSGPMGPALNWVRQVTESDDVDSWFVLDPSLRRWFAQNWLTSNPTALSDPSVGSQSRDELVDSLIGPEGSEHPLFHHLWRVARRDIVSALGPFSGAELSAGTRPRPVGPGLEAVRLFRASDLPERAGVRVFEADAQHLSFVLLLRRDGGRW